MAIVDESAATWADEDRRIGQYICGEEIGQSRGTHVIKVRSIHSRVDMALKMIDLSTRPHSDSVQIALRWKRETSALDKLHHPNVIPIYDAWIEPDDRRAYIVMKLAEGGSLYHWMHEQQGPLPISVACSYAAQMLDGLHYAHGKRLIHRDIKPANILLHPNLYHVWLADFGAVKDDELPSITKQGCVIGTPEYMDPAIAKGGQPDRRTDVYSVGCLLFEMVTGRLPYDDPQRDPIQIVRKQIFEAVPWANEAHRQVNIGLALIINKAMQKDPDKRYPTAWEFRQALLPFSDEVA